MLFTVELSSPRLHSYRNTEHSWLYTYTRTKRQTNTHMPTFKHTYTVCIYPQVLTSLHTYTQIWLLINYGHGLRVDALPNSRPMPYSEESINFHFAEGFTSSSSVLAKRATQVFLHSSKDLL